MQRNSYYAKRLQIILACYNIQYETNAILEALESLPEGDVSIILAAYVKESKIMRFKPYLEKIISDIRAIDHKTKSIQLKAF